MYQLASSKPCKSNHMNNELVIDGDVTVKIIQLNQSYTYGGLIEGLPTKALNEDILNRVIVKAREECFMNEVYIVEPDENEMFYSGLNKTSFEIPNFKCIARVESLEVFKDPSAIFSGLVIVWFQESLALPIEPEILEKIKMIPYRTICAEYGI